MKQNQQKPGYGWFVSAVSKVIKLLLVRFVVSNLGRPDPLEGPLRFDGWMEMVSSLASKKKGLGCFRCFLGGCGP